MNHKIVVAITGASGAIYAKSLLNNLKAFGDTLSAIDIVLSNNAKDVWKYELQDETFEDYPFRYFANNDFNAPFASGSANYTAMIICPCSMGTLGRIANGISENLITRTADVMLKERRKLILVTREMPLSLIHINNMKIVTEAGGVICPASPSYYSLPQNFLQLADTVTHRALQLAGLDVKSFRWGEN